MVFFQYVQKYQIVTTEPVIRPMVLKIDVYIAIMRMHTSATKEHINTTMLAKHVKVCIILC